MTYLPLARKYRPQTFADLVGQPHVTTTLTRALEQKRLGQAYLFTGLRGIGKTSAARILAKCLNCAKGPTPTPCNTCPSCAQITQGNSLDVIEIDGASNRGIDEIRSLRETVAFAPTLGAFRIYIIDEVHMLTMEAFNALLKTLEEPPAHVKFIFATTAANKVPATILSRCQRFDFRRLEASTVVGVLSRVAKAEKLKAEEPALYAIARAADGSLRDAEVVLEQLASFVDGTIREPDVTALLGTVESELLVQWMEAILDRDATKALTVLTAQIEQGKDVPLLAMGLLRHVRNLLILASTKDTPSRETLLAQLVDEPSERIARLDTQGARSTPEELVVILQMLAGAYDLIRRSPVAQTILELAIIKLATREQWQSLDALSRRLEQWAPSVADAPPVLPRSTQPARSSTTPKAATAVPVQALTAPAVDAASPSPAHSSEETALSDSLLATWASVLGQLGSKKMSLAAYLMEARPLRLEGAILTVGLPGFALHHEVLSEAENRRLITTVVSELYGASLTVEYTTLPAGSEESAAPASAGAAAERSGVSPMVQDIVNLFNATIMDRPSAT